MHLNGHVANYFRQLTRQDDLEAISAIELLQPARASVLVNLDELNPTVSATVCSSYIWSKSSSGVHGAILTIPRAASSLDNSLNERAIMPQGRWL